MSHPLLTDHPPLVELRERRAELDAARRVYLERRHQAEQDYRNSRSVWEEQANAALLRGEEPPPEPTYTPIVGDPGLFTSQIESVAADERALLRRDGVALEAMLFSRERELLVQAQPMVSALRNIADELEQIVEAARVIRRARQPGVDDRLPTQRLDPATVAWLAEGPTSLLHGTQVNV